MEYPDACYHVMNRGIRGKLFSERMRIIYTLFSLRGRNLEEIGREFMMKWGQVCFWLLVL